MNGVINIDKPAGMTSHDVVGRVRRITRIRRVGHAGTLDPDATGVLLVCVGAATRLADFLAGQGKTYQATLYLGRTTSTEDASGETLAEADASHIDHELLSNTLPQFIGEIQQIPPMVSAVHHNGRRLYELAREGQIVERQPRTIQIDSITLVSFHPGQHPTASLNIECGKGTYIRTLCADIGAVLGVGGHMETLRRTRVGAFNESSAVPLDALTSENVESHLTPSSSAVDFLPEHTVETPEGLQDILHGRSLATTLPDTPFSRVVTTENTLIALARVESGTLYPFKVFAGEDA